MSTNLQEISCINYTPAYSLTRSSRQESIAARASQPGQWASCGRTCTTTATGSAPWWRLLSHGGSGSMVWKSHGKSHGKSWVGTLKMNRNQRFKRPSGLAVGGISHGPSLLGVFHTDPVCLNLGTPTISGLTIFFPSKWLFFFWGDPPLEHPPLVCHHHSIIDHFWGRWFFGARADTKNFQPDKVASTSPSFWCDLGAYCGNHSTKHVFHLLKAWWALITNCPTGSAWLGRSPICSFWDTHYFLKYLKWSRLRNEK